MKKYYFHDGREQHGPFDIEELKAKTITRETPVWYEGLPDWTPAGNVEELKTLFIATPPPFSAKQTPPPPLPPKSETKPVEPVTIPVKKERNTAGIILTLIGVVGAIAIIASMISANSGRSGGSTDTQTYQEKVMSVEEMERADPTRFLDASGTYNENFWGTKMKIHGKVTNNATVANYKDVAIEVLFYSGTETVLDRKQYVLYEFVPAHTTRSFEWKVEIPRNCKKLGWNVVSATPY